MVVVCWRLLICIARRKYKTTTRNHHHCCITFCLDSPPPLSQSSSMARRHSHTEEEHHFHHRVRINRAFHDPLQLSRCTFHSISHCWSFHVSSSRGVGYYDVWLCSPGADRASRCSCPDFVRRRKPCKHLLCVLLRILKLKNREFASVDEIGEEYPAIAVALGTLFGLPDAAATEATEATEAAATEATVEAMPPEDMGKVIGSSEVGDAAAAQESKAGEESVVVATLSPPTPAEEETCLICLLDFAPPPIVAGCTTSPDAHLYTRCNSICSRWLGHQECLSTWFARSNKCPLCKGNQQRQLGHVRIELSSNRYSSAPSLTVDQLQANDTTTAIDDALFFSIEED